MSLINDAQFLRSHFMNYSKSVTEYSDHFYFTNEQKWDFSWFSVWPQRRHEQLRYKLRSVGDFSTTSVYFKHRPVQKHVNYLSTFCLSSIVCRPILYYRIPNLIYISWPNTFSTCIHFMRKILDYS